MIDIYQVLKDLQIPFVKYTHPAVFTVEDAKKHDRGIKVGTTKNLLLQNKKADTYFLVIMKAAKRADLKKLSLLLAATKLSFVSAEKLQIILGLTPGSVSPFGLINNVDKSVNVIVDEDLLRNVTVGFHPNVNTATLVIKVEDFKKFLNWTGNKVIYTQI